MNPLSRDSGFLVTRGTTEDRAALLTCLTMPVAAVWGDGVATVAIVRSTLCGGKEEAPSMHLF